MIADKPIYKKKGTISDPDPDDKTFSIRYDDTSEWTPSNVVCPTSCVYDEKGDPTFSEMKTTKQISNWAYVCNRGARVALIQSEPARCGTVIALDETGTYQVRLDNSQEVVNVDIRPGTALPEAHHQYQVDQKLVALSPLSPSPEWADCVVDAYLGREHGCRHTVRFSDNRKVDLDLNRFNHATAELSATKFLQLREKHCQHLSKERSQVVDAITGKQLDIAKQTIKVGMTNIGGHDATETSSQSSQGMVYLSKQLTIPSNRARLEGKFDARPVLVKAEAGAGKSWGVQQLEYHLATLGRYFWVLGCSVLVSLRTRPVIKFWVYKSSSHSHGYI